MIRPVSQLSLRLFTQSYAMRSAIERSKPRISDLPGSDRIAHDCGHFHQHGWEHSYEY